MGKLNYSARKIGGIKAGQVVSKDLKKRIPPGIGSKAAARDPTLEIDIACKDLTDAGFAQFIDDLIDCVKYRNEQHPSGLTKVTELHLQSNQLTIQSLAKLAEVITLSPGDLRELDLSQNEIQVVSAEEQMIWNSFLKSFTNCFMLKKLDLSGNPLGPVGLEILARVYIKSDLDYLEADAGAIIGTKLDEEVDVVSEELAALKNLNSEKENESSRAGRVKKSPCKGKGVRQNAASHSTAVANSKAFTAADLKKYTCTRGLRSIPYLNLSDSGISVCSAVHLSCMLQMQRTPEQLLAFLPTGKAYTIHECEESSKSIVWKPNGGLAPFATKLLEVAETIHESRVHVSFEDEESGTDGDDQRKLQSKRVLEYSRLSKRVRMEFLKHEGVHASQISITALKMMIVARALLLNDQDRDAETGSEEEEESAVEEVAVEERIEEPEPKPEKPRRTVRFLCDLEPKYSFPIGPFHPAAERFDAEFPALRPTNYKDVPVAPPVAAKPVELETEQSLEASGNQSHRCENVPARHLSAPHKTRKGEGRFRVPLDIWRRIIAEAVGADGILDQEQQDQILHYASDWDIVAYELTIKGTEDHQQIWKFLETVNCFAYTPLA
ncbi:hypothetical protein ARAM_000799 [Aspergillus rambellii]|uniref:Leucine rich repeat protein n=1 Tax=Aspergillus rambellii TaxID=308745 RepID=A0A0F8WR18_9EURO|nr:hypothetical protein ARAM_000799 [Aspergillus rambellii]